MNKDAKEAVIRARIQVGWEVYQARRALAHLAVKNALVQQYLREQEARYDSLTTFLGKEAPAVPDATVTVGELVEQIESSITLAEALRP